MEQGNSERNFALAIGDFLCSECDAQRGHWYPRRASQGSAGEGALAWPCGRTPLLSAFGINPAKAYPHA